MIVESHHEVVKYRILKGFENASCASNFKAIHPIDVEERNVTLMAIISSLEGKSRDVISTIFIAINPVVLRYFTLDRSGGRTNRVTFLCLESNCCFLKRKCDISLNFLFWPSTKSKGITFTTIKSCSECFS